jgi:hypothetical protein
LKTRDALLLWLFSLAVEYAINIVQEIEEGLNLNAIRHFLVYADDVNILDGNIHTVQKNTETILVSSKEISLEEKMRKLSI